MSRHILQSETPSDIPLYNHHFAFIKYISRKLCSLMIFKLLPVQNILTGPSFIIIASGQKVFLISADQQQLNTLNKRKYRLRPIILYNITRKTSDPFLTTEK